MKANLSLGWRGISRDKKFSVPHLGQKVSPTAQIGAVAVQDKGWAGSGQHDKDNQRVLFLSFVLLKGRSMCQLF